MDVARSRRSEALSNVFPENPARSVNHRDKIHGAASSSSLFIWKSCPIPTYNPFHLPFQPFYYSFRGSRAKVTTITASTACHCFRIVLPTIRVDPTAALSDAKLWQIVMERKTVGAEDTSQRLDGTEACELPRHRAPPRNRFDRSRHEEPDAARSSETR